MREKGLSQEGLKLIACVTMLIDHIGATLVIRLLTGTPGINEGRAAFYQTLRIIGRIAFPIYCFLLVEGAQHTRNPRKYALRLFIGMLLSEIPFDLAFSPTYLRYEWHWWTPLVGFNPAFNSVMMTLLLGFGMILCMKRLKGFWRVAVILPFYILAEALYTDYAGLGILIIAIFALTRDMERGKLWCVLACAVVMNSGFKSLQIFGIWVNMEIFALLAFVPIFLYDGRKLTKNKAVQWGFYLFYPAHILVLALLKMIIFGTTPFR